MSVEQFASFFASESRTWNRLVRETGIKVD
jgi:hypothetical protein